MASMDPGNPVIRLRQIAFKYEEGRTVLRGVDLDVRDGEKIGLVGSNGSGKTTLLHLIVGLHKPTDGTLEVLGRERREEKDFVEIRGLVGITFQDPDDQLFCPTVLEDVAFGPLNLGKSVEEAKRAAAAALEKVGLSGFDERVTYRMSFGEKKLAALAAVLAMEPKVLLFDEPMAGLDEDHAEGLIEILRELPQAMMLVSHDPRLLDAVATRRVKLHEGRIAEMP